MLHATSRTAKLAGVAALAGMMMAVAIVAAVNKRSEPSSLPAIEHGEARHEGLARELDRCAPLTMPDSGCEAAWAENRRRFFRQPAPATNADGGAVAPAENAAP